jgi:hypothetical protein
MTVPDGRAPFAQRTVPQPRAPQDDVPAEPVTTSDAAPQENAARPRSEYWDVATASWHSRAPYPRAEQG